MRDRCNKKAAKEKEYIRSLAARLAYKTADCLLSEDDSPGVREYALLFYLASWLCAPQFPAVCSEQSHYLIIVSNK
jgi:hypothetical protein